MTRGKFVVFEGIDGCGKGTQMMKAVKYIFGLSKEYDLYVTREPTRDFKEIRAKMATDTDVKKDPEWYATMFVKDRINHESYYIEPALKRGTHAMSDRHKPSTLTYQWNQGMNLNDLIAMHEGLLIPDLTLIIDCPAIVAFERRKKEGATDVFDKDLGFQESLRKKYLELPKYLPNENITIVDGNRPIDTVFYDVQKVLDRTFKP